jgi:ketosteroid isomerase-like protein
MTVGDIAAARDEIRTVLASYCHGVDSGDIDRVVGLFTDDAVIEMAVTGERFEGSAAIRDLLTVRREENMELRHVVNNEYIEIGADGTTATSACYAQEYRPDRDGAPRLRWVGRYTDDLVNVGGEWRFRTRRVHIDISRRPTQ